MKTSFLLAATLSALAAGAGAHAQGSVTLCGIVDAGMESVGNVASIGRITRMPSNIWCVACSPGQISNILLDRIAFRARHGHSLANQQRADKGAEV